MGERGRVLSARPGINPNSSGHGVMWGLFFFLPQAVVGGVLAAWLERRLAAAMAGRDEAPARVRLAAWLVWAAAWAGFTAAWVAFVAMVAQLRGVWAVAGSASLLGLPALAVIVRAWSGVRRPALRKATWQAVAAAAVAVLLTLVLLPVVRTYAPQGLGLLAACFFLASLSLALAGAAYRLGRPGAHLGLALLGPIYVITGIALLVLPFPALAADTYNPVGLFFPFWGLWAPAFLALSGLSAMNGRG